MKRILWLLAILMMGLMAFSGLAFAQEEEETGESETVEAQIVQAPPCQQMPGMMPGMPAMTPGMMGNMCGMGGMGCGMMPGGMGRGMMGGKGCGMMGGQNCGMMCGGGCCGQICQLGCAGHLMGMAQELELTEAQIADLKAICSAHKKEAVRKKAEMKIAEMELGELAAMPNADLAKVKAKLTEICSMKQSMCLAQFANIEKARKVLTTEQMKKFKEMRSKMSCAAGMPGMMKMRKSVKVKVEK